MERNKESMRIGIEVQHMFRPKKLGTDIIIDELLKQLQNTVSRHEFFLYAQGDKPEFSFKEKNMHLDISCPASANIWEEQVLPKAILKNEIDLLHCTSNTAPVGLNVPLVITIQDISWLEKSRLRYGSWYQRFENLYSHWNMPRIAKMADMVITVSDYEREQIIGRLKIPPSKVKTIYHACAPHFTPRRNVHELAEYREKWNLPERYILFFGNASPGKNVGNVLKALNLLYERKDLDFVLVMPGLSNETLERLLIFHQFEHLKPYIFLTGYISNGELPNLYRMAELFLYPSLSESFGMPILEAMACGTPVITSNRGAIPEVAGKDALMINPKDPAEIAAMISTVLNNDTLKKEAGERGLKTAARYTWQQTVGEIISIYEGFTA